MASGGREVGLGHLARTAELAREAASRGWRVAFALRGDASAEAVLERELPGVPQRPWKTPADLLDVARHVVFDTRDDCADELAALSRSGARTLVLDRTDLLDRADWTVLPVLHAAPCSHPRVRAGGRWCMVPEAVRRTARRPEAERDALLLSFGGADPLNLTERLAAPLAAVLREFEPRERTPALHAVIGPSFAHPDRTADQLAGLGFHVHRALPRAGFAALAARAQAACVGFGTTLQELAWLGVPFVSVTHHASDVVHAARLEALGLGASGGFGGALDPAGFTALLARSLFDPAFRERSARRGAALLGDGRGAARILALLAEDEDFDEARAGTAEERP